MRGHAPDGNEVELTEHQEELLHCLQAWLNKKCPLLAAQPCTEDDKAIVVATAAEIERRRQADTSSSEVMA